MPRSHDGPSIRRPSGRATEIGSTGSQRGQRRHDQQVGRVRLRARDGFGDLRAGDDERIEQGAEDRLDRRFEPGRHTDQLAEHAARVELLAVRGADRLGPLAA